jgi:nitrous oxidase accessory protein NosD
MAPTLNRLLLTTEKSNKENNNTGIHKQITGNIIENSKLTGVTIKAYPAPAIKFHQNSLSGDLTASGTSTVTNNTIIGTITVDGSATVWKNTIQGSITCSGYQATEQKYPIISCNTVSGSTGAGIGCSGYAQVEDNTISNCKYGISISIGYVAGYIFAPHVTALRNKVSSCEQGLHLEIYTSTIYTSGYESVTSNTFSHCKEGVHASGELYGLILKNNNIIECSSYRFYLEGGGEVNATLNWWGTTDTAAIKQSIYDSSRDFNLGTVTFEPLLTAENTEAYPNQNAEMPTMQSTNFSDANDTSHQPQPKQTNPQQATQQPFQQICRLITVTRI